MTEVKPDSREMIQAAVGELVADYARNGSVCDGLYHGILDLLDRQAALTEREICKWWRDEEAKHDERIHGISELQSKVDELQAELDEYGQTHMLLPVDADGVSIKLGDRVVIPQCYEGIVVSIEVGDMETLIGVDGHDGYLRYGNSGIRHVKPRTIEDVLRDCCTEWNEHLGSDWETGVYAKYAAEIRELMRGDGA